MTVLLTVRGRFDWTTRALAALLALSLSGVLPVAARVAYADTPNLLALSELGQDLEQDLEVLVRRARHPGTPGTPGGIPTRADADAIEARVRAWRTQLLRALALPNAPANVSAAAAAADYLPIDAKLQAINAYLNTLSSLITLRMVLRLPCDRAWRSPLELEIPRSVMVDFPGLGASAQGRLGETYYPLVVDRGADGRADPVRIRLSESLLQGLELGLLADRPDSASFLTMIQYLATRQLLQNLADLRYLKQDRRMPDVRIPAALLAKLRSMGMASDILEEQHRAVAEPGARLAIRRSYSGIETRIPSFVNNETIQALANAMGTTPAQRRDLGAPLRMVLTQAERDYFPGELDREVEASSLILSTLPTSEMLPTLRQLITNAKASTQLTKLLEMIGDSILVLAPDQRVRVLELIETRKRALGAAIPDATLESWRAAARGLSDRQLYETQRVSFIESLVFSSHSVAKRIRESFAGSDVRASLVARAHAEEFTKMNPRQPVQDWLFEITQETTYAASRDRYAAVFAQAADPRVLVQGRVEPARVLRYIERHDFRPDITFSERVNPTIAERIIQRVTDGRKKDLRDLLSIGDWMGFNNPYLRAAPNVREILTNSDRREKYFDALSDSILSEHPILAVEVAMTTEHGGTASKPLYDALNEANPRLQSSPDVLAKASPLVDQALIAVERKIQEQIRKVGRATDLREIEKVVTSSLMLQLVMSSFPEFKVSQESFVEELIRPSLTHQIMHRYVGWYLGAGFGALMLLHVTRWVFKRTTPFVNAIMTGLRPLIGGYMRSAMVLIVADTVYQAHELYQVRERRQDIEDLFFTGAYGRSFYDYGDLAAANSGYQLAKWFFVGRLVMDGAFMYVPIVRGAFTRLGTRLAAREFAADIHAFERLGVAPGRWSEIDEGLAAVRSRAATVGEEGVLAAERAHARLTAKVRAGETWDLDAVRIGIDNAVIVTRRAGYSPIAAKMRIPYREAAEDLRAMRELSLDPSTEPWGRIDAAIARLRADATLSDAQREVAEAAYARLAAKVREGAAWRINSGVIESARQPTSFERHIRRILTGSENGGHVIPEE